MSLRIALAGNPNSGKTTLFNALTGAKCFVGNWPGVTVEKKEGKLKSRDDGIVTDLPGIYSLSPYTLEEVIAGGYLTDERPDVILNIIDGTNLERNLYLTTQLMELGIPVAAAINMMDEVNKNGDKIDTEEISHRLGIRVTDISALKGIGVEKAAQMAIEAAKESAEGKTEKIITEHIFSDRVEKVLAKIEEEALQDIPREWRRWYAVKIFERDGRMSEVLSKLKPEAIENIENAIKAAEQENDDDSESIIAGGRYTYIGTILKKCYKKRSAGNVSDSVKVSDSVNVSVNVKPSDKIDRIVTDRWLGLPIFAAVMFLIYHISMATVGAGATEWVNEGVFGDGWRLFGIWIPGIPVLAEKCLEAVGAANWLSGLINDGIIAGVGAVLGFIPQMLVLFFLLAVLEDCGYVSRIAFVLDRIFRKFGLSGKSFIPMLIGTGCGVPGIMASRTIENERDRRMTIITTTFIPCSAKIPFISMMAGAIFGGKAWVATSSYFIGMAAIIISGIILKKTKMFAGNPAPFVMELPAYRMPAASNILRSMRERGGSFIRKAGTIILLSTILIWFTTYFGFVDGTFRMLAEEEIDRSLLAYAGNVIAWIFRPLGWGTYRAVVASVTGLVAKENIVGTMGILYGGGDMGLYQNLAATFGVISGYSFLIFNLLCAPCFAAIGAIRREMGTAAGTWFAISWQCMFAYAVSLMINQFGMLIMGKADILGLIFAVLVFAIMVFMLVRPYKEPSKIAKTAVVCYTQRQ